MGFSQSRTLTHYHELWCVIGFRCPSLVFEPQLLERFILCDGLSCNRLICQYFFADFQDVGWVGLGPVSCHGSNCIVVGKAPEDGVCEQTVRRTDVSIQLQAVCDREGVCLRSERARGGVPRFCAVIHFAERSFEEQSGAAIRLQAFLRLRLRLLVGLGFGSNFTENPHCSHAQEVHIKADHTLSLRYQWREATSREHMPA